MPSFIKRIQTGPWWLLPAIVWGIMVLAVIIRVSLASPKRGSVYPVFATAGQSFAERKPLYVTKEGAYRYAPAWAAFFSLGNHLPQQLASILWRLLNLAVFIWGAYRFQRRFFADWSPVQQNLWWVLMFPFCLGSFNNAQANLLLLGLLLGSMVTFAERRWLFCGMLLAVAISTKIYPMALALLLILLQPIRLAPALLLSLAAIAGLPFLFQDSPYVMEQYRSWFQSISGDLRIDRDIQDTNRDVWLLIRVWQLPIDYRVYQMIQMLSALGLAVWTWYSRHALTNAETANERHVHLFNLAMIWMLLFGPASESSTYALVAPMLAMAAVAVLTTMQSILFRLLVAISFLLMLVAHFGSAFPQGTLPHAYGIHPISTLLLAIAMPLVRMPFKPSCSRMQLSGFAL